MWAQIISSVSHIMLCGLTFELKFYYVIYPSNPTNKLFFLWTQLGSLTLVNTKIFIAIAQIVNEHNVS